MKSIKKEAFAVYSGDGRGYSYGNPLSVYPFRAACECSKEYISQNGYAVINKINIIQFEDINYIYSEAISIDKLIGNMPTYTLHTIYKNYLYKDGFDKSKYIYGDQELINFLDDGGSYNISQKIGIRDNDFLYILLFKEPVKINSFTLSREMAIKNALGKLTSEEKSLLGLK